MAACRTFPRVVRDGAGKQRRILALAHVASDPDLRGVGLGKQLVTAALGRVSRGEGCEGSEGGDLEAALFQTAVAPFYVKLGAVQIENEVVNSTGEGKDEKRRRGFWDPQVARYGHAPPSYLADSPFHSTSVASSDTRVRSFPDHAVPSQRSRNVAGGGN